MCSSIKGRRIHVTKEDLILMMEQSDEDKAPLVQQFCEETQIEIKKIEKGSLILICDFQVGIDGPSCHLELVGWKGAVSMRVYIPKNDRVHFLRLCGMDVSKYGMKINTDVKNNSYPLMGIPNHYLDICFQN